MPRAERERRRKRDGGNSEREINRETDRQTDR
jgi:hypothetical protein